MSEQFIWSVGVFVFKIHDEFLATCFIIFHHLFYLGGGIKIWDHLSVFFFLSFLICHLYMSRKHTHTNVNLNTHVYIYSSLLL